MRGSLPWLTNRARVLRSAHVSAEQLLWGKLRNRQLGGFKFVRQEPVGPYFADFVCRERMLVVEVDGGTHSSDAEIAADAVRSECLETMGYRLMRVWNSDLRENLDGVMATIYAELSSENWKQAEREAAPHPGPLPVKDGERG